MCGQEQCGNGWHRVGTYVSSHSQPEDNFPTGTLSRDSSGSGLSLQVQALVLQAVASEPHSLPPPDIVSCARRQEGDGALQPAHTGRPRASIRGCPGAVGECSSLLLAGSWPFPGPASAPSRFPAPPMIHDHGNRTIQGCRRCPGSRRALPDSALHYSTRIEWQV